VGNWRGAGMGILIFLIIKCVLIMKQQRNIVNIEIAVVGMSAAGIIAT